MSQDLYKICQVVEQEIKPNLASMTSERQRIDMRSNLSALEKMIKDYRRKLLQESKTLKLERKNKRLINKGTVKNEEKENDANTATDEGAYEA